MEFLDDSISKVISLGSIENNNEVLHIAYGIDRNFLFGAAVSMQSIVMNNLSLGMVFHLFTDYVDDNYLDRLDLFVRNNQNIQIHVYKVSRGFIDILPSLKQWSYATFFRLIAFQYLSGSIDKVLYIDADVICKGSLNYFLTIELEKNIYAAVIKDVPFMQDKPANRLGIDGLPGNYFNAGVVYLKLEVWKQNDFLKKSIAMLASDPEHKKYKCLDQDILNILFFGHCVFISGDYDCFYGIDYELSNDSDQNYKMIITNDTKLIHYVGVTKPWNNWTNYPCQKFFNDAYKISFWNDISYVPATTESQLYIKYRHEWKKSSYYSAFISFLRYYEKKIKRKYFHRK